MEYTYQDYKDKLDTIFEKFADKSAVVYLQVDGSQEILNYSDVKKIVGELEELTGNAGLKRADRIAVISPHSPFTVILNLSLAYSGYTAVLIDAALPLEEQRRLIEYSDVNAVFTVRQIYDGMNKEYFCDIPVFEICPDFTYRLFGESVECVNKVPEEPTNGEVIAIIFSSGTTSTMKGVEVTYHSICQAFDYTSEYVFVYLNPKKPVRFLNVLPSNHIAGYSVATSCVMKGGEMGFISEVNAQNLGKAFQVYQPSVFIMIPQVYSVIKNKILSEIAKKSIAVKIYFRVAMSLSHWFRKMTGRTLSFLVKPISKVALGKNMNYCGCGTAPCPNELLSFYLDLGMDFVNVYGTTETGFPVATGNCYKKYSRSNAISASAYAGVEVKLSETDEEGVGELRVKTPLMMNGYFKEPELTKTAYDEDGYFKTGDTAYIDTYGEIHITGRVKEAILLANGKKVSPTDIDEYYAKVCGNAKIASCGVPNESNTYDEICMFIECGGQTEHMLEAVRKQLLEYSSKTDTLFKLGRVEYIEKIPMTSVGKIKRFELKEFARSKCKGTVFVKASVGNNTPFFIVSNCITKIRNTEAEVTLHSKLNEELGFDSLAMFELCVEIEKATGIAIIDRVHGIQTVEDIVRLLETSEEINPEKDQVKEYPAPKGKKEARFIKRFARTSYLLWNIKTSGVENIPKDKKIIFSPNHESYFDAMWVTSALQKNGFDSDRICCLAAEHLLERKLMKKAFVALGGIPVDRNGNTAPAIKRATECLQEKDCYMIIHPEGTRTRTGELGEFKNGVAKLSIETGTKIVPVCINGAYEIFPPSAKLPKLFRWRRMRRYSLELCFGPAIDPVDMTKDEITGKIRDYIVEQKKNEFPRRICCEKSK